MKHRRTHKRWRCASAWLVSLVVTGCALLFAAPARASDIRAGFDLFQTEPGTGLFGVGTSPDIPFAGVPFLTFDFGGAVGVQDIGNTDTIVERKQDAGPTGPSTIPIELVALSLQSLDPVDLSTLGGPRVSEIIFVTLQSDRGRNPNDPNPGPPSDGQMDIDFNNQTFDSEFEVFFDIRVNGFDGQIIFDTDRPDGAPQKLLDSTRLSLSGWHPQVGLEEGLRLAYADYQVSEGA